MVIVENLCRSELAENGVHIYSYRMTKGNITFSIEGEKIEVQSYGIEIEKQDVLDGVITNIERDGLESISPQRYKIHNLLKVLYDGRVSPYHFIDVIGEYVDSYVEDFEIGFCDVATI